MLDTDVSCDRLRPEEMEQFAQNGFLIQRSLVPHSYIDAILKVSRRDADCHFGDIEYEADVQYPGSPGSIDEEGGRTIRRLRQAFSRDPIFSRLVKEPWLLNRLRQLVGPQVVMPLAHHNCVMTKNPCFSSDTGWHQDTRYWSFTRPDLVNVWLALGEETLSNGCLRLLPGTHRLQVSRSQLDDALFLREDLPENQLLLETAVCAELQPGDVLFFHARCFHAATRNYTDATKYSAVFTFRSIDNSPVPGTRSAECPELLL
ncbi:MAG: phytanoyl-CoA dioxygenase family protein [Planctomycetaceae bacterium]|nr:phytanoyl-CoA dioxygenase family protein [Planctomycetaceae bacterium]